MPIEIQCTAVVIRNSALDRVLEEGAQGFESIAPNAMSYADECLSQASFMAPVDAEEYAKRLELLGLERTSDNPDFVVVNAHDQSVEPPCEWLILFEYDQRLVATLKGNRSTTLVAAAVSHKDAIKHYSAEEIAEQFEFVERQGNIDTYRHKESGNLVYHTRTTETADEIFVRAFKIVWSSHRQPGTPAKTGDEAARLSQPIADLQSLIAKHPDAAKPYLALGMAWFALGKADAARRQLERAAELDPTNSVILKELGAVCLDQADFPEAVKVAARSVAIQPDDTDLLGNLALSQFLAGELEKAEQTIAYALTKAPDDKINHRIKKIIDEVRSGQRPQPRSLQELMSPSAHQK